MIYYRVKKDYQCFVKKAGYHYLQPARYLVKDELLTPKEYERIIHAVYDVPCDVIEEASISRKRTHWLFGARFEDGHVFGV